MELELNLGLELESDLELGLELGLGLGLELKLGLGLGSATCPQVEPCQPQVRSVSLLLKDHLSLDYRKPSALGSGR